MTDGTRPNEGDSREPTAPSGEGTDAAQHPVASPGLPVPPYAAQLSAPAGAYPPGAYPGAAYPGAYPPAAGPYPPAGPPTAGPPPAGYASGPRQEYPGAPPTWGPSNDLFGAPSPRPRSTTLAVVGLCFVIFGVLFSFVPLLGALFAWAFVLTGLILAIVSLVRRAPGTGMAIAALVIAVGGFLYGVVNAFGGLFGYDREPYDSGYEYEGDDYTDDYSDTYPTPDEDELSGTELLEAPDIAPDGNTRADALLFGTPLSVTEVESDTQVWNLTVQPLQDVTAAAVAEGAEAPENGAFLVLPVDYTNLTDQDIDLNYDYSLVPNAWLITGDGGNAELDYLPATDYPTAYDLGTVEPGQTVTAYQVFDVAPSVATTGTAVLQLSSGQTIYWNAG